MIMAKKLELGVKEVERVLEFIDVHNPAPGYDGPVTTRMRQFLAESYNDASKIRSQIRELERQLKDLQ